jgi:hypothetical protein
VANSIRAAHAFLSASLLGNHASEQGCDAMRMLNPDRAVDVSRLDGVTTAAGAEAGSVPVDFS